MASRAARRDEAREAPVGLSDDWQVTTRCSGFVKQAVKCQNTSRYDLKLWMAIEQENAAYLPG
jgi:hypothetical protein